MLTVESLASKCPGEVARAWCLQEAGRHAARVRVPGFMEHIGTFGAPTYSWEVLGHWGLRPSGASLPLPLYVYNMDTVTPSPKGFARLNESISGNV